MERLTEEIDGLTKETKQLSAVDDFVKLSKLRRTIIKKEKALAALSAPPSPTQPAAPLGWNFAALTHSLVAQRAMAERTAAARRVAWSSWWEGRWRR